MFNNVFSELAIDELHLVKEENNCLATLVADKASITEKGATFEIALEEALEKLKSRQAIDTKNVHRQQELFDTVSKRFWVEMLYNKIIGGYMCQIDAETKEEAILKALEQACKYEEVTVENVTPIVLAKNFL